MPDVRLGSRREDLVLYYGDQSYFKEIVSLGKLEGDVAQRIAELPGRVTVTVEAG